MSANEQEQVAGLLPGGAGIEPSGDLSPFLDEREQQINEDHEWCLHDREVRRLYGGRVVAANRHRVWGVGPNHAVALEAALREPGCPPRRVLALVVVPDDLPPEPGPKA